MCSRNTGELMIQIIKGLPDNVVGIVAKGRVTNEDCKKMIKPAVEQSLKRHPKIRLYYEISCRFPGAAWENLEIGVGDVPQWERIAVVSDVGWLRHTLTALRFLIPSEITLFPASRAPEALAWITTESNAAGLARGPAAQRWNTWPFEQSARPLHQIATADFKPTRLSDPPKTSIVIG